MDFVKKEWQFRDLISENELNRMEDGIEEGITKAEQAQDDLNAHINATTGVHGATSTATPNTLVQRDPAGRFKAGAPSASDDVARKAEVDAITTEKINTTAYRPATEDGSTYPIGVTSFAVSNGLSDGWPQDLGVVSTTKLSDIRCLQIFMASSATGAQNGRVYVRSWRSDSGWSNWRRQWDDQEMGAGSGLDADLLDGRQPSTSATANTIVQRDSSGRAKFAAPAASDDAARKAEVDAVQNSLSGHIGSGGSAHAVATTSQAGFMSASDKSKLNGIQAGAQVNAVTSVAGKTGAVTLSKGDVGLGNVQNYGIASQAQAEAGSANNVYMTPLRTKQAIDQFVLIESGTFTPGLHGSTVAGYHTYSARSGVYYRIGNRVFIEITILLSAKDSSMSGTVRIAGLPFTHQNNGVISAGVSIARFQGISGNNLSTPQLVGAINSGTNYIELMKAGFGNSYVGVDSTDISSSTYIVLSANYRI